MRRDYKYLYLRPAAPFVGTAERYTDPVRTDPERRAIASRITKRRARLRRTKAAERWIVFTVTLLLAIAMWPVLLPVGAVLMARALWRRYTRAPTTANSRNDESSREARQLIPA